MSIAHRHSRIKGKPSTAAEGEYSIPWTSIAVVLALILVFVALLGIRLRYLHHSVSQSLVEPRPHHRYLTESYRGVLSYAIGNDLLDAANEATQLRDQQEAKITATEKIASTFANDAVEAVAHNPRFLRRIQSAIEHGQLAGMDSVSTRIENKLSGIPKPRALPADVIFRKIASSTGAISTLQFQLCSADEKHMNGISIEDVLVTDLDGKEWPHITIEQILAPLTDHSIAILVDKSSSMAGERMLKLQAGLELLIANCDATTRIQIVAFDSKVTPLTAYTNDHRILVDVLRSLVANGATEITKGLDFAIVQLASKAGNRSILLCTDGQDPNLASNLQRIVTQCNRSQISINVLGLEDASLDKAILAELAKQTEGHFCLADRPLSINEQINRLIGSYSKPSYRLSVFNPRRTLDRFRVHLLSDPRKSIDVEP